MITMEPRISYKDMMGQDVSKVAIALLEMMRKKFRGDFKTDFLLVAQRL